MCVRCTHLILAACIDACSLRLSAAAEHVQIGCQIISSCVLLGKGPFLQQYGGAVLHSLQAMLGESVHAMVRVAKTYQGFLYTAVLMTCYCINISHA